MIRKPSKVLVPVKYCEDGIPLHQLTIIQLERLGSMDDTYDDVVNDLIDHCVDCDRFWVDRE